MSSAANSTMQKVDYTSCNRHLTLNNKHKSISNQHCSWRTCVPLNSPLFRTRAGSCRYSRRLHRGDKGLSNATTFIDVSLYSYGTIIGWVAIVVAVAVERPFTSRNGSNAWIASRSSVGHVQRDFSCGSYRSGIILFTLRRGDSTNYIIAADIITGYVIRIVFNTVERSTTGSARP
jgi:predicted small secreted protein